MSRTVARGLTALTLGGLSSLALVVPAHAATCPPATYPPGVACVPFSITVTVTAAGKTFTIHLSGFKPGSPVDIVIHSTPLDLGTFTADATGAVDATLTLPSNFPAGAHTITASGIDAAGKPFILASPLTVAAAGSTLGTTTSATGTSATGTSSTSSAGLPFTGFELGAASLLGVGLLGAGSLAVVSGRKRKSTATPA